MPITLTAPPAVVEGARSYAERSGMTLEAFVLAYLESVAKRERERRKESFYNAELAKLAGTAEIPAMPGCITEGDTLEETKANIREAAEVWLATKLEWILTRGTVERRPETREMVYA